MSRMVPDDQSRQDTPLVPDQPGQAPHAEQPEQGKQSEEATLPGNPGTDATGPQASSQRAIQPDGAELGEHAPDKGQTEHIAEDETPEQPVSQAEPMGRYQATLGALRARRLRLPDVRLRRRRGRRERSKGRIRRFARRPTVRVIGALLAILALWVGVSVGQALAAPGGGSASTKIAEWARDHHLGPLVTLGEWLTYQPPKAGGNPSFSLTVPKGENAATVTRTRHVTFKPIIPAQLSSLAGKPLAGEGQWRVLEAVKGHPAIFGTFLRQSATYSSYVSGIVSMDQRLVKFQLHPGSEDPGGGGWGLNGDPWIPPGKRAGLVATFNGGFKLDSAKGGFYLNGKTHGSLAQGAASIVYYKDGSVKIGQWGRDFGMSGKVAGVRQNLKLIVDHGAVPGSVDSNVQTSWGATLGGGYYVWRSGLGMTKDGRIIFVYGPALNVRELATLLQHAGAQEALELDINPDWMSYEYYQADGKPSNPTPSALLPTQPGSTERYYSIYSRDFTAVYAR